MSDSERLPAIPGEPQPPAMDTSYEIELGDPLPPAVPQPVDPPPPTAGWLPAVPEHLQTLAGIRKAAGEQVAVMRHRVAFHGLRLHRYLLLTALWAAVGTLRLIAAWLRWWLVPVPAGMHADAAGEGWRAWKTLHSEHKKTAKARAWISLAAGGPVVIGAAVAQVYGPWWWWLPAAVVVVPLLARAGHPPDKPILKPATVTPRFRRINADIVLRAYYAAGLGNPDKPDQRVAFGVPPMARDGDGSRVTVDLPYGLGLDDAVKARAKIASGLDVQVSQVFLHRDPTSHRRHVLWVADRDPLAVPVGRTPLLAGRQTDIWQPAPLGLDERGRLVTVPLMWNSILVSALPRAGKTFSARLLALFAALDPHVQLGVFDAKGSPDWRKFALVAEQCAFGLTPTKDGLPPETLRDYLVAVKDDVQDRYARLSAMPVDICPEGKLTREIAHDPRFGMPVRLIVLEEFQEYYDLGDISKDIAALLTFLVKVAPGAGVILLGSTQRPSGIGTGEVARQFTQFRDNFAVRFGLRTSSWQVSELCLGAGAYSEGLDTSTLLPQYKGVGILRGADDASPTVRTYLADGQDAERVLVAARALRERAGTLTGYAAGQQVSAPARDVLADVLAVFGADSGLQWQLLAARLAARFPERWADATGESVSADLRAQGVPVRQVKMFGQNLNGCRRADIEQITARR